MTEAPAKLGVLGAGVMGAGIAQLGAQAGIETVLCDCSSDALAGARRRIEADLERAVGRGRLDRPGAARALRLLTEVGDASGLGGCDLVIEAVPEDRELKVAALSRLADDVVLATNTSSLSVTAIAAGLRNPSRVVGMHFFNPPTVMKLVEVVAGAETGERALRLARATARAMGRTPILARDGTGFVVNRCLRPFYGEALRLVDEGVAPYEQVDRILRLGAGFRMGAFELMDLVGTDTNLAVAESFAAQSFGEPRWRPSPSQRLLVQAGRLGRKSGRGWYDYRDADYRPPDPALPAGQGGDGRTLLVLGADHEADGLAARALEHGFTVERHVEGREVALALATDPEAAASVPAETPLAVSCAGRSLASAGRPGAVGFHLLPPASEATVLELTRLPVTSPHACDAAARVGAALGLHVEWVDDAPGLVLGRVVAQLVNEACFAVGEGVVAPGDADLALTLGLNHPFGPVTWGERLGWDAVLERVDALWHDRHDPRYRAAPLLRRAAGAGLSVRDLVDPAVPRGSFAPPATAEPGS